MVAGIRTPEPIDADERSSSPRPTRQPLDTIRPARGALPRRAGHRVHDRGGEALHPPDADGQGTAAAALAPGGRQVDAGLISKEEAVGRSIPRSSTSRCTRRSTPRQRWEVVAKGLNASPGGRLQARSSSTPTRPRNGARRARSVILVRWETTPDDFHGMVAGRRDPHRPRRTHLARRRRRAWDGHALRHRL